MTEGAGSAKNILLGLGLLLIFANLVVLDTFIVRNAKGGEILKPVVPEQSVSPTLTPEKAPAIPDKCPSSCVTAINDATSAVRLKLTPTRAIKAAGTVERDSFIPIATGSYNSVNDWGDVPGAQVYVDTNSIGQIKNVTFEASVHVPNTVEDVYVRLYNSTDKHPVWKSELFFPSGTSANFLVSQPIALDPGSKLYKVQMKTQFSTNASLDQSRIHITAY